MNNGNRPDDSRPALNRAAICTLAVLALACSCILALAHHHARSAIEQRGRERIHALTAALLPDVASHTVFTASLPGYGGTTVEHDFYAGYDVDGALVGVVIEAMDRGGYGGTIKIAYGYMPDEQKITRVLILHESETPDIGDRIRTEPAFLAAFEGMEIERHIPTHRPRHPISYVPPETNGGPGQVEGISGATVSARAVIRAMRVSTDRMLPVIHTMREELEQGAP